MTAPSDKTSTESVPVSVAPPQPSSNLPQASVPASEAGSEEIREDRWAALLLLLFGGLFALILLWEPLSSLLRR